ncbi:MAG: hypothetical protein ACRDPH_13740 [Marmoricola sp.]
MEILDYLKLARRRLWVVVVLPLLAGAGVLGVHEVMPSSYTATAYVFAPNAVGGNSPFNGPSAAVDWANAFTATATSPKVTAPVSHHTGVSPRDLETGLQVAAVHESGQLEVSYTARTADMANRVVKTTSARTMRTLFASQLAQAEHAVSQSNQTLTDINKRLLQVSAASDGTPPDQAYATELTTLAALQKQRGVKVAASGSSAAIAALSDRITAAKQQLATLEPLAVDYQNLKARQEAASTTLSIAQQDFQQEQAQFGKAATSQAVTLLPVTTTAWATLLFKGVLPAMIAALFIAFGLLAAWEMLTRRGRATSSDERFGAGQTAFRSARLRADGRLHHGKALASQPTKLPVLSDLP